MSYTRLYQAVPLKEQTEIKLDEKASHHLSKVLRASVKDTVVLFNGNGGEYSALIQSIDKKSVTVLIDRFFNRNPESPLRICLAQGVSRGEKMDFTIQKAVELGVKQIVPLLTNRCNVKLDKDRMGKKIEHWQAVAISAAEQSGRTIIPRVEAPCTLTEWINIDQSQAKWVLDPEASTQLNKLNKEPIESISLVVGPEGGLSEAEINQLVATNYSAIRLGPRVLRTETAGLAAISIIQSQFGDMC